MPFKAQISQAHHTLLFSLAASATVSCILSFILIHTINSASQERSKNRRMLQAMDLANGLERSLVRQRRDITDLDQIPKRLIERDLKLAASGLDVARVHFYNHAGTLFHTAELSPFAAPLANDSASGVALARADKTSNILENLGDIWFVRVFVPVHNRSSTVIGTLQVVIDVTHTRNLFFDSNRESLFVVIFLILISSAILYLVGNVFIGRMGDALRARAQSEEELERSQQLARVGLMVSGLSHQLRNPLSILNGIAGALNRRPALDEQRPFLTALNEETARIIRLCEVFLDFAKPICSKVDEYNVRDFLRQLEDFLRVQAPQAKISVLGSPGLRCKFDRELAFQALVNIALNSIEAVQGRNPPEITVTFGVSKGVLSIQISDNGQGFSDEHLEQLGNAPQPFYSTKAKGTGLGLAIADKIATAHGGRIEFSNNPSGGARVTFIIETV